MWQRMKNVRDVSEIVRDVSEIVSDVAEKVREGEDNVLPSLCLWEAASSPCHYACRGQRCPPVTVAAWDSGVP